MAQLTDDDLDGQSFGQLLAPQQTPVQGPSASEGGLGQILGAQGAEPSMFEKGQQFAQQNPMASQMLLHTFMRMAQGGGRNFADTLGKGVAAGAGAGLMHLAQGKQDKEKADATQRQQQKEQQDFGLRDRAASVNEGQLGIQKREADLKEGDAPGNRRLRNAQASKYENEIGLDNQAAPLKLQQIQAQIAAVQQSMATSRDSLKTAQLGRQLTGLQIQERQVQLELDKTYAPVERGIKVTQGHLANQGAGLQNMGMEQELADNSTLTTEQRIQARRGGTGKTPVSDEDRFLKFVQDNQDFLPLGKDGKSYDPVKTRELFEQLRMTPQMRQQQEAEYNAAMQAARAAVKVGENYRGPDGRMWKRKN